MDLPDSSLEPGDLPELFACCTSVSTHQPARSHGGFVASDHSDHLVTVPFENRNRAVVDDFVTTHILHAPQPSRPLMYQWPGSTYMGLAGEQPRNGNEHPSTHRPLSHSRDAGRLA